MWSGFNGTNCVVRIQTQELVNIVSKISALILLKCYYIDKLKQCHNVGVGECGKKKEVLEQTRLEKV